jgi:hypothetical protein
MPMSVRKTTQDTRTTASNVMPPPDRPRKKARAPRVRLTHFEVRRGETLRLRIAVADDALADVGDELGALIKRIAPSTQTTIIEPDPVPEPDFLVSRAHVEHDAAYHDELREHLAALFTSLCDTGLEHALDVARNERARRAEGAN